MLNVRSPLSAPLARPLPHGWPGFFVDAARPVGAPSRNRSEQGESVDKSTLAWGRKVSQVFRDRVFWIADDLDLNPDFLMACMAWESAETFRPDIRNAAGSGATGLIQFMPSTARALGTSTTKLAAMTAEDQLNYVYKYFAEHKGRLRTLSDTYMAILWPKGIGKPESHTLWDRTTMPTTYRQNSGLDIDRNGYITKAEAAAKVQQKLVKGMSPAYRWVA